MLYLVFAPIRGKQMPRFVIRELYNVGEILLKITEFEIFSVPLMMTKKVK